MTSSSPITIRTRTPVADKAFTPVALQIYPDQGQAPCGLFFSGPIVGGPLMEAGAMTTAMAAMRLRPGLGSTPRSPRIDQQACL